MKLKASDRNVLVIVLLVAALVIGGCFLMERRVDKLNATLAHYDTQLTNLENDLAVKKAQVDAGKDAVIQAATGMDAARKTKDDDIAYQFLFRVLNWDGISDFNSKRSAIMEEYNISQNSRFAQCFFSPMPYTPETSELYNCRLSSVDTMVSGISGTDYSYFSEVEAVAGGPDGVTSKLHLIFMYTIDADGNISNLDAYNGA